jgi:hypothetical protein
VTKVIYENGDTVEIMFPGGTTEQPKNTQALIPISACFGSHNPSPIPNYYFTESNAAVFACK